MKNKSVSTLTLVVIFVFVQAVLYKITGSSRSLPFCTEYQLGVYTGQMINSVFLIYLPVPFILFLFSGRISNMLAGYGKLIIIRSHNKRALYNKIQLRTILETAIIVILQSIVSVFINGCNMSIMECIFAVSMYYLSIVMLIFIMTLLEQIMDAKTAYLVVNIYLIVTLFAGSLIYDWNEYIVYFFILPISLMVYGSGFYMDVTNIPDVNIDKAAVVERLVILLIYVMTIYTITKLIYQKKDVL